MLKKSASGVLARHSRLTISAAFTGVPCLIRHGVNLRGSTYRSVRLASSLAVALLDRLFEHPAVILVLAPYDNSIHIVGINRDFRSLLEAFIPIPAGVRAIVRLEKKPSCQHIFCEPT